MKIPCDLNTEDRQKMGRQEQEPGPWEDGASPSGGIQLFRVPRREGLLSELEKRGETRKIRAEPLCPSGSKHMEQVIREGSGSTEHKLIQGTPLFCRARGLSGSAERTGQ